MSDECAVQQNPSLESPDDDDDDPPILSTHALAALKEFFSQQYSPLPVSNLPGPVTLVSENWRLSQFWYDSETATTLTHEILTLARSTSSKVACIACPTLYAYLKNFDPDSKVHLLEYDKRFEQYGSDYTFYDYNEPECLPPGLMHSFGIVVADPPYLSEECLEKVGRTVRFVSQKGRNWLLLVSGEVQRDVAARVLGLNPCGFRPKHDGKLGNEFRVFTNYDPGMRLGGWEMG